MLSLISLEIENLTKTSENAIIYPIMICKYNLCFSLTQSLGEEMWDDNNFLLYIAIK